MRRCDVAIIGSGFAGSLLARVLATLGRDVVLVERGTHPRFAIGESTTPLANLSLERIACRYGLRDCYDLAAHGRWVERLPQLRRGLKRGFTFYRHHPGEVLAGRDGERLLVAASPNAHVADSHWLRADVDHHFVRAAQYAGVDYMDRLELTTCAFSVSGARLRGMRDGESVELAAPFVIDASGPGGFLARQLGIPSAIERTFTRSSLLFSHFEGVREISELLPGMQEGPYPDDWAAMHHVIDEGWMYSLRFDDGVVSAGVVSRESAGRSGPVESGRREPTADMRWRQVVARYPTIDAAFADARPTMPVKYVPLIQHRLARAAGDRWLLMPHAFAFVDPLFSTGIAWALRAVERIALMFENSRLPSRGDLSRYDALLSREGDQIDRLVAGAYHAMPHFEAFVAQALIYFAAVSYAETRQRVAPGDDVAWSGFLGIGDDALEHVIPESHDRLRRLDPHHASDRQGFVEWATQAIAPRNIAGFADPARHNLYPLDVDMLVDRHDLLGLSRDQLVAALPTLRGMDGAAAALG
ncbi:MAG TPA: tryptophan 7-halogenase [Gemmatimonadaceae bacterium]|nr:tryptophan 7-halogenase [Gemmatimonadaceae bacterium]